MLATSGYGYSALSNTLDLHLGRAGSRLQADVAHLSSGMRIQTAADDPSGLAIAEHLQSQVNGYDQASSNVQTATNSLLVADGALESITDLLQRLRSLAVQANDDLVSATDRSNIQSESQQLFAEINHIADQTNFNGLKLLNRGAASPEPNLLDGTFPSSPSIALFSSSPTGSAWTFSALDSFGASGIWSASALIGGGFPPPPSGATQVGAVQGTSGTISQSITGFRANTSYTLNFNLSQGYSAGGPSEEIGVFVDGVQLNAYTPAAANPLPTWESVTSATFTPGAGTHVISLHGLVSTTTEVLVDNVQLSVVGSLGPDLATATLNVQDGAAEGDTTQVNLPTVYTSNLGIATDTVGNSSSAALLETHVDAAINSVSGARATLGAQMVALQIQSTNAATAAVNLNASQSAIRDTNIAQTATSFAADQLLAQIGTSIIANVAILAASVEKLFA